MNMIIPNNHAENSEEFQAERDAALHEISEVAGRLERLADRNEFEFLSYLMKIVKVECTRNLEGAGRANEELQGKPGND